MFSKLIAKLIIRQLRKSPIENESVLRVLIYYLAVAMQKKGSNEIEIEYTHEDDENLNLSITCKLKSNEN